MNRLEIAQCEIKAVFLCPEGGENMNAIIRPICQRCGYRYEPAKKRRVLIFQCEDGDYTACEKCIELLGALAESGAPEAEKDAVIRSFKNA